MCLPQNKGSEDHRDCDEPREADVREGRLRSQLQGSVDKAINARKAKEIGRCLCTCYSEKMIQLPLVKSCLPDIQGSDGTLSDVEGHDDPPKNQQ